MVEMEEQLSHQVAVVEVELDQLVLQRFLVVQEDLDYLQALLDQQSQGQAVEVVELIQTTLLAVRVVQVAEEQGEHQADQHLQEQLTQAVEVVAAVSFQELFMLGHQVVLVL
jgi:hypothetical protein